MNAAKIFNNEFTSKTKADFIGSHLGETAPRTDEALRTNLDGVIFIDEAYELASIDIEKNQVDPYGLEFGAALVDFMTRFKGLYCIIAGGYEGKMRRQFMAANEGIARRFPYFVKLDDVTPQGFVDIFQLQLVKHHDGDTKAEKGGDLVTERAKEYIRRFVKIARRAPLAESLWRKVGNSKPKSGFEIANDALAGALQGTVGATRSFGEAELKAMNLYDVQTDDFVKSGGTYYVAAGPMHESIVELLKNQAGSAANMGEFAALYRDSSAAQRTKIYTATRGGQENTETCDERVRTLGKQYGRVNTADVRGSIRLWIEQTQTDSAKGLAQFEAIDEDIGALSQLPDA